MEGHKLGYKLKYRLLKHILIFTIYMFGGGLIFMYLESEEAKKHPSPSVELLKLRNRILTLSNITGEDVEEMFAQLIDALEFNGISEPYKWDYYESCFFVGSLLTTIGYGHVTPKTTAGRAFAVIYSLFGIPLTMLAIRDLCNVITNFVSNMVTSFLAFIDHRQKSTENLNGGANIRQSSLRRLSEGITLPLFNNYSTSVKVLSIIVLFLFVLIYLFLSAMFRVYSEDWTFFEGFYFWYITLTTIGFGDFVPYEGRKPSSDVVALIYYFGSFYLLLGMALVASFIQCIVVLLQGRLPAVQPSQSTYSIRSEASISRLRSRLYENPIAPPLRPRHVSFTDEEFGQNSSNNPSLIPRASVHLCIASASCGGALNGLLFQACRPSERNSARPDDQEALSEKEDCAITTAEVADEYNTTA